MKNKKTLYAGIATVVIAIVIMLAVGTKEIGDSIEVKTEGASTTPQVVLPQVAEGQGIEYEIAFDDFNTERKNDGDTDVIKIVHQMTRSGQSFDYLVQFNTTADTGLLQIDNGVVFLGNNVKVNALNIIEGDKIDDGYDIEVVMENRTILVPVTKSGFIDQTNVRIR